MKLIKKIAFSAILSYSSLVLADDCKMTFGYEEYRPFYYTQDNKVEGLDIELMDIISKKSDCTVNWVKMYWTDIVDGIKSGKVTGTTSANMSENKETYANFIAYRPGSIKVFVRDDEMTSLRNIKTLEELIKNTKLTIGVYNNYSYGSANVYMLDPQYKERFVAVNDTDVDNNFVNLDNNKVDVVFMDAEVGVDLIKNNKFKNKIIALPIELNSTGNSYIMLSKAADAEDKLYNKLSAVVSEVKTSDAYTSIINKYNQ